MGDPLSSPVARKFLLASWIAFWSVVSAVPGSAQSVGLSQLFGDRVQAIEGAKTPVLQGDFDGDGKADQVFLVNVVPDGGGKSIASDVRVVDKLFGGQPLGARSVGRGLAIALKGGAQKFLIVDFELPQSSGFFETPTWASAAAHWDAKREFPLKSKKRGSEDLKGFPCLGKSAKGDVILVGTESGVVLSLPWTGTSFKKCENPNDEP